MPTFGGEDLLAQNVSVSGVPAQLLDHVEQDPSQAQRPSAIVHREIVESEAGRERVGLGSCDVILSDE
jgi:hypothetical protein